MGPQPPLAQPPAAVWPVASRSKQYAGNRVVKVGGISLNIDADWVAGAVARK